MGFLDTLRILAAILALVVAILTPLEKKDHHSLDNTKSLEKSQDLNSR